MIKLEKIRIVKVIDSDPDLSHLGEYSDTPKPGAIDREKEGDLERGEYRYFNPGNYDPSDPNKRENALLVYRRYEDYNRGEWGCIGIKAEADVLIQTPTMKINKCWISKEFGSGGLWGIESDSGPDYFKEVVLEELEELKEILKEIGIPEKEIEGMGEKAISEFMESI
jgi:hypothetical protein